MIEKHLPYFNLMDAMESADCPICHLIQKNMDSYFETLNYEGVNDQGFRANFRRNEGFCPVHSHRFLSYQDALAIVITHREILVDYLDLKSKPIKRKDKKNCHICEMIKDQENRFLNEMSGRFNDDNLKSAYLASKGLCLPHYILLAEQYKRIPIWITEFQINKTKTMITAIDRYVDWSNFTCKTKEDLNEKQREIHLEVIKYLYGLKDCKSL